MANLVVCCDGTWNTADQRDHGVPVPTNVALLGNAVADTDAAGKPQQKYYHTGVGTGGTEWDRLIGGGTGRGLDQNIMSAYEWLCQKYTPGADIYLFGFSRGAYTVRSLCGLITHAGLLDPAGLADDVFWPRVNRVFQQGYRRKNEGTADWRTKLEWKFHEGTGNGAIPIRFIGVWDTVGALGIPDDMGILNLLDGFHDYTFHDTELSPVVKTARHAMALDEMRASFQPTHWTNPKAGQDLAQLWFPGVHSDVGGGYPETGLSNGALLWMIGEANNCGLNFNSTLMNQIVASPQGVLHDSYTGAFALLAAQPRAIPSIDAGAPLHASTLQRQANPPISQSPYRQVRTLNANGGIELDIFARKTWNETGIWLDKGSRYTFSAKGEWIDSTIKCGPAGCHDGHFQLGEVAQLAGTVLGEAEQLFKVFSGNRSADFRFTRRHEDLPWFSLVGAIANGDGVDAKGHLQPHETFAIGNGCTYVPQRSGYFYAYANDAWNCYGNNRGSVVLTVK
jgi:uncharacterized protein (DUF2235 family)